MPSPRILPTLASAFALALGHPGAVRAQLLAPDDLRISSGGIDSSTAAPSAYAFEEFGGLKPPLLADGRVFRTSLAERCPSQAKSCAVEVRVDVDAPRPGADSLADPVLNWRMWGAGMPDTLSLLSQSNQDGSLGRIRTGLRMRRGDSLVQLDGRKVGETGSPRRMRYHLKVVFRHTLGGHRHMAVYARLADKSYRMPLFKTTLSTGVLPDSLALSFLPGRRAPEARLANLLVLSEGRHYLRPAEGRYLESLSAGQPQSENPRVDYFSDALLTLINASGGEATAFGTFEEQMERNRNLVAASEETLILPIQALRTRIVTREGGAVRERELFLATTPWREIERTGAQLTLNAEFLMGEVKVSEAVVTIGGEETTLRPGEYLELDFSRQPRLDIGLRVRYADGFEGRATLDLRSTAGRRASLE